MVVTSAARRRQFPDSGSKASSARASTVALGPLYWTAKFPAQDKIPQRQTPIRVDLPLTLRQRHLHANARRLWHRSAASEADTACVEGRR